MMENLCFFRATLCRQDRRANRSPVRSPSGPGDLPRAKRNAGSIFRARAWERLEVAQQAHHRVHVHFWERRTRRDRRRRRASASRDWDRFRCSSPRTGPAWSSRVIAPSPRTVGSAAVVSARGASGACSSRSGPENSRHSRQARIFRASHQPAKTPTTLPAPLVRNAIIVPKRSPSSQPT